jgi:hypothetical protein
MSEMAKKRGQRHTYYKPKVTVHTKTPDSHDLNEAAWGLSDRDRYLIRLLFGDVGGRLDKLQWLQHVFENPEAAVQVPQYRSYVAAVLRKLLDMIHTDQMLFTRVMVLAQRQKGVRTGVNEDVQAADGTVDLGKPAWLRSLLHAHAKGSLASHKPRAPFKLDEFKKRIAADLTKSLV